MHAKVVRGEVVDVVVNAEHPLPNPDDEARLRQWLEVVAKETVELFGIDHQPIHYIFSDWGNR